MKLRAIFNLVWLAPAVLLLVHTGPVTAAPAAVAGSQSPGALADNSSAEGIPIVPSSRFSHVDTVPASPQLFLASSRHSPNHPFAAEPSMLTLKIPLSNRNRSRQSNQSTSHPNHSSHSSSKAKPAKRQPQ